MADTIVRAETALPGTFGILVPDNKYAPRYRPGDVIEVDGELPALGDEVLCETTEGEVVIGDLVEITGHRLVLADSCHVKKGPEVAVSAAKYWRIRGYQVGAARPAIRTGGRSHG